MSLAAKAISKRTLTTFISIVAVVAGLLSYLGLGQLEDPEFTIKNAVVMTPYPGASPEEVELEITDVIEQAIQEMPQLKELESNSRAGVSSVKVTIKAAYRSDELPQIWDVLSVVPGVAKVTLWGVQQQCIYLDVSEARLSQLGIAPADIRQLLAQQNLVIDAGSMDVQSMRMRFDVAGEFRSPEDVGDLVIKGRTLEGSGDSGRLLRVRDIADVRRGYVEPTTAEHRYDGRPAIAVAISNAPGVNVVDVGVAIDRGGDAAVDPPARRDGRGGDRVLPDRRVDRGGRRVLRRPVHGRGDLADDLLAAGGDGHPAHVRGAAADAQGRRGRSLRGRAVADDATGSLTLIGTVSPAGGNFDEPVTQATLATVKTFLGLSYDRAYKRFYPAIDPLTSWSRYLDQLADWFREHMEPHWIEDVGVMAELLRKGDVVYQMMQVTGEEGITIEDYVTWQKATLVDMVYLQQDAFDAVDASMPLERQLESFKLIKSITDREIALDDKDKIRELFTSLTGFYKNLNYSAAGSPEQADCLRQIDELLGASSPEPTSADAADPASPRSSSPDS